ncbi:oxidoreductase family protein [Hysterangium stoloniferum]|nr:oxidoreductase family protein [Hysterangium stoloniferum]
MSSPNPARIALLGAGIFATEAHLPALSELTESASLVAIYSRSFKSADTLSKTAKDVLSMSSPPSVYHDQGGKDGDLNALLSRSDVDAVIIALPITIQPDIIRAAFAHDKHVLSEKPVAPSVAEGLELIGEYEAKYKGKLLWRVAENDEAEPAFRKIGELVKGGAIGKVTWWNLTAVGSLGKDVKWYKTPWRTVPEYQGGFLLDGGVHSAALLRTALPSHPISLSAHVSLNLEHLAPADTFTALSQSSDGSHGLFELVPGAPNSSRDTDWFKITGKDGWIDVRFVEPVYKVSVHRNRKEGEDLEVLEIKGEGVKKEIEHFLGALHGKTSEDIGDPREALRDVAFIQAGLNSKGEKVDLEKLVKDGK